MQEELTNHADVADHLKCYFSGELEKSIRRLKRLVEREFPEDYYCTVNAVNLTPGRSSNSTGHADFTASRAIHLADIRLTRKRIYKKHVELREGIKKQLEKYDQEVIDLLKADLGLIQATKTEIVSAASFGYSKSRVILSQVLKELSTVIRRIFDECD
ncbi:MAG: hypothetical protein BHK79_07870 [Halanaerobium sp. MDAL1]|jgi:hypothetical protein|nr:MAG: hypothetical protein BHK79_07870 [Halanaerobium sp. MDAL1]